MISKHRSPSARTRSRPAWRMTWMSTRSRSVPASSGPTSSAVGCAPVITPGQRAWPAASSTAMAGVRTKRLRYRADSPSNHTPVHHAVAVEGERVAAPGVKRGFGPVAEVGARPDRRAAHRRRPPSARRPRRAPGRRCPGAGARTWGRSGRARALLGSGGPRPRRSADDRSSGGPALASDAFHPLHPFVRTRVSHGDFRHIKGEAGPDGQGDYMDAITLLKDDHKTVERLFKRVRGCGRRGPTSRSGRIVDRIIEELSMHAAIEEHALLPGRPGPRWPTPRAMPSRASRSTTW